MYTDLAKDKNILGFESGITCFYPSYKSDSWTQESEEATNYNSCTDNVWYADHYRGGELLVPPEKSGYDPRCRDWYRAQYRRTYSIFTDIYTYANNELGITNCVPLWQSVQEIDLYDATDKVKDLTYYGAYCLDQLPTSGNTAFLNKYYRSDKGIVDYLIFNEDLEFAPDTVMNSTVFNYIQDIVFKDNYTVLNMTLENRQLNQLDLQMEDQEGSD